jgi:hypothetical protein
LERMGEAEEEGASESITFFRSTSDKVGFSAEGGC